MKILVVLAILVSSLQAKELEACYRIYFLFFPVAKSCVHYVVKENEIKIRSWAKTVVVGSLVKRINSWGESTLLNLKPKSFSLFQREGNFIRDHFYYFNEQGVSYKIVRYKGGKEEVKEGVFKSSIVLFDPFSATLVVYLDTPNPRESTVHVFYDGDVQSMSYRTEAEEKIKVLGKEFNTWRVLLIPRFDIKGVLKPKGKWHVWIEKETLLPVKLKVSFTIGTAYVYLDKVKGSRKLLTEVKNGQAELF